MKIDVIDQLIEQDILKHRVCKIKYSSAYENYLREKFLLLGKSYTVVQMEDLFTTNVIPENINTFKSWRSGLLKNLFGMIPKYGYVFTVLFSISDTIRFFKTSDLEKLREKFQLKEKPHKKYRKIKKIILVRNVAYLNADEIDQARFIQELIDKRYIINTLLVFCEPMDFSSGISVIPEAFHVIPLNNEILQSTFNFCLCEDQMEILEILGIEYAEYVHNLESDLPTKKDSLVKRLIHDMLQKAGYKEEERLIDFLKLCSLLFDIFCYEDIEVISDFKNVCCEEEIKKSVDSRLIKGNIQNEYHFLVNKVRKYYQSSARLYAGDIKKQILCYLTEKYPQRYADLALAYILASDSNEEKISICLKALYYDQRKTPAYKMEEIISYLGGSGLECMKVLLQLNEIYSTFNYSQSNVEGLCKQCFYGLADLAFLSPEDKLICLSDIAKVSYEVMKQPFLLEIDATYRKLFGEVNISRTYEKYTSFILDYVVFSTCIENHFETSQVVQRLVKYLYKSNISLQNRIRYSRLGNALFYNDPDKGMELTKQAYDLSQDYVIEHKCATINYSCSLGICGEYSAASQILWQEFERFLGTSIIDVSAENNYIIVSYLSGMQNAKWLVKKLKKLCKKAKRNVSSDILIVYNNYLAAMIEENQRENEAEIEKVFHQIQNNINDPYHSFYLHQNKMTYYFIHKNYQQYKQECELCCVPGLLSAYEDFFKAKADFLETNINKGWNIQQLQEHLATWGEIYPEKKYSLYKRPVLFGFIERWFE